MAPSPPRAPGTSPSTRRRSATVQVRLLLPRGLRRPARDPLARAVPARRRAADTTAGRSDIDVETLTAPTDLLVVMPDAGPTTRWLSTRTGGTAARAGRRRGRPSTWSSCASCSSGTGRPATSGPSPGSRWAATGRSNTRHASRGCSVFAGSYSGVFDPLGNVAFSEHAPDLWGDPVAQADVWKAHDPTHQRRGPQGHRALRRLRQRRAGAAGQRAAVPSTRRRAVERECAAESAAFVQRLAELKIPVTVYAYGNGTHSGPYIERDLHRSFPLILKALGE